MIERSLPKEARIVTGLQVARRAHRQAETEEKNTLQYPRDDGAKPLTPFSKDHFKFVAISIKAIPAAFCRSREEKNRLVFGIVSNMIFLSSVGFIAVSQLLQAGVVGAYTSNLSEVRTSPSSDATHVLDRSFRSDHRDHPRYHQADGRLHKCDWSGKSCSTTCTRY
jgi:hypothetical protein